MNLESIIQKAVKSLPQAVWFHVQCPQQGAILLDSFVLKQPHASEQTASTHIRLMIMSGDVKESNPALEQYHEQIYQQIQQVLPAPPPNVSVLGHVACVSDAHVELSYTLMRDIAEQIAKVTNWPILDISISKPNVREIETLDIPLYQLISQDYKRKDLSKKPFGIQVQENKKSLRIITKKFSSYLAFILIPMILVSLAFSVILYSQFSIYILLSVNTLLLVLGCFAVMVEKQLVLDDEGVELHINQVFLGMIKKNAESHFISWSEIEEIQTMSTGRSGGNMEHLSILSGSNMIYFQTYHANWIWQLIMVWLSENKERIGKKGGGL